MGTKEQIINRIIEIEGGYVNDPGDSGGETNFGITKSTAMSYGYAGPLRDLPRKIAFDIYTARYWDAVKADEMPGRVAAEIVDAGVNVGPGRAGMMLQRALNVLNLRGSLYPDLTIDGVIGPTTLRALRTYLKERDETVLLRAFNCLRGAYYIELAERREKDERFIYGWLTHRVSV